MMEGESNLLMKFKKCSGNLLWWKVSESNLLKSFYEVIFNFYPDPDPPVRVAGRIRKLVSRRFYPLFRPLSSFQNVRFSFYLETG